MPISYLYLQRFLSTTLIALTFSFAISAQKKDDKKPAGPPPDVSVNLRVMDTGGKPVPDIKTSDVKIFEDGVEQKIDDLKPRGPLKHLTLVFDNTGSMRQNLEYLSGRESTFTTLFLNGNDLSVIRFVGREKITIEQPWTTDKTKIEEALENLFVEGGQSAVLDGINVAAENFPKEPSNLPGHNVILLISDCEDLDSYYNTEQTTERLKKANIQVFVLSFSASIPLKPKNAAYLSQTLALETGGTEYALPEKNIRSKIPDALRSIAAEQNSQYILKYRSTNPNRDGLPRKLTVQIADGPNGEKRSGVVRDSFSVPKPRKP